MIIFCRCHGFGERGGPDDFASGSSLLSSCPISSCKLMEASEAQLLSAWPSRIDHCVHACCCILQFNMLHPAIETSDFSEDTVLPS
jgi:hypothetical protein